MFKIKKTNKKRLTVFAQLTTNRNSIILDHVKQMKTLNISKNVIAQIIVAVNARIHTKQQKCPLQNRYNAQANLK